MRRSHPAPEPETRVGNCAGCHAYPTQIFKVPGIFRYRCGDCFVLENGQPHHLATTKSCAQMVMEHLDQLVRDGVYPSEAAASVRKQLTVHVIRHGASNGLTTRDIVEQFIDSALVRSCKGKARAPLAMTTGAIAVHKHMGGDPAHCALCGASAGAAVHR